MARGIDTSFDQMRQVGRSWPTAIPKMTTPYRNFSGINEATLDPDDTLEEVAADSAFNLVQRGNSRLEAWDRTAQTFGIKSAMAAFQEMQAIGNAGQK
jgi:hypothetical protein